MLRRRHPVGRARRQARPALGAVRLDHRCTRSRTSRTASCDTDRAVRRVPARRRHRPRRRARRRHHAGQRADGHARRAASAPRSSPRSASAAASSPASSVAACRDLRGRALAHRVLHRRRPGPRAARAARSASSSPACSSAAREQATVARGNFFALFTTRARAASATSRVIVVGVPVWYVDRHPVHVLRPSSAARSGCRRRRAPATRAAVRLRRARRRRSRRRALLSQRLGSRRARARDLPRRHRGRRSAAYFTLGGTLADRVLRAVRDPRRRAPATGRCSSSTAAEQFGTNLRATVATTVAELRARLASCCSRSASQALTAPLGARRRRGRGRRVRARRRGRSACSRCARRSASTSTSTRRRRASRTRTATSGSVMLGIRPPVSAPSPFGMNACIAVDVRAV